MKGTRHFLLEGIVAFSVLMTSCDNPRHRGNGTYFPPRPAKMEAVSGAGRIDLYWSEPVDWHNQPDWFFEVSARSSSDGIFEKIHDGFLDVPAYSDFTPQVETAREYRVRTVLLDSSKRIVTASSWSDIATGTAHDMENADLISEVQQASFRYFWNYRHPVSGLPREGIGGWNRNMCSVAAAGMMFFNMAVGMENKWITRDEGLDHIDRVLTFLTTKADRYHGVFPHWLNGHTGKTIPFSDLDNGADLVETSFLIYGALFFREYIRDDSSDKARTIRENINAMWEAVEWSWFVKKKPDGRNPLLWHWSPDHDFAIDLEIVGFNECHVTYILALASPTFPIEPESYFNGWIDSGYGRKRTHYDIELELGREEYGPPLFFTHYSYLGMHPEMFTFGDKSYFDHFKDFCRIQQRWAAEHRREFPAGGIWGMSASLDPDGYGVHYPGNDNGTISPSAFLASMPYAPEGAVTCLNLMYRNFHKPLWGPFGFYDAMNLERSWFSDQYIGIDVGPIAPMIENHKTGLCWKIFAQAPELKRAMEIIKRGAP
jgi:hypothetical protein